MATCLLLLLGGLAALGAILAAAHAQHSSTTGRPVGNPATGLQAQSVPPGPSSASRRHTSFDRGYGLFLSDVPGGGALRNEVVDHGLDCGDLCIADRSCNAWTYAPRSRRCLLFDRTNGDLYPSADLEAGVIVGSAEATRKVGFGEAAAIDVRSCSAGHTPDDKIAACNRALAARGLTAVQRATLLASRGIGFELQAKDKLAVADWRRALEIDPHNRLAIEQLERFGLR